MIFVDSNVIIDVIERDDRWLEWSSTGILEASRSGRVCVSAIVAAEVAPSFPALSDFLSAMAALLIEVEPFSVDAGFRGGTAFRQYLHRRDGTRAKSLIADFLIGGHAASLGASLLTRDPRFYARYFPGLPLITPETTA